MPLPEFTKKLVESKLEEYCNRRIPPDARHQIKLVYKMMGNKVTLIETRPYYQDPSVWTENPLAQFRFDLGSNKWSLYCSDRNGRWHLYDLTKASADFDDMLKALDLDQIGIFWG